MNLEKTGVFATVEQLAGVTVAYNLEYNTPVMAVLPGGRVPESMESFRDSVNRYAHEAGLRGDVFGIDPETMEFIKINESVGT